MHRVSWNVRRLGLVQALQYWHPFAAEAEDIRRPKGANESTHYELRHLFDVEGEEALGPPKATQDPDGSRQSGQTSNPHS
jgi:hypothetical protein